MAAKVSVPVTSSVVRWALEEDGRPYDELAEAVGVAPPVLEDWASGASKPSQGELTRLAERLQRPRALFFLPQPPESATLPPSFRRSAGDSPEPLSHSARRFVRRSRRVQRVASWLRRQEQGRALDLPVASANSDPEEAADAARRWLQLAIADQLAWPDASAAFRGWRSACESHGIYVFRFEIGRGDIRGFSLWDAYVPVIAVNASDTTPQARAFTIGHELGHLVRRAGASCSAYLKPFGSSDPVERWCERFSAALLLPAAAVQSYLNEADDADVVELVRGLARRFKVSAQASALRVIELGLAKQDLYWQFVPGTGRRAKAAGGGGMARPRRRLQEFGPGLTLLLDDAVTRQLLPARDAYELLNVPVSDYRELTRMAREQLGVG